MIAARVLLFETETNRLNKNPICLQPLGCCCIIWIYLSANFHGPLIFFNSFFPPHLKDPKTSREHSIIHYTSALACQLVQHRPHTSCIPPCFISARIAFPFVQFGVIQKYSDTRSPNHEITRFTFPNISSLSNLLTQNYKNVSPLHMASPTWKLVQSATQFPIDVSYLNFPNPRKQKSIPNRICPVTRKGSEHSQNR